MKSLRACHPRDRGVRRRDLGVRKSGCDGEAIGERDVSILAVVVASPNRSSLFRLLTRGRHWAGDLVEKAPNGLQCLPMRDAVNADDDVEDLADVDDRHLAFPAVEGVHDVRRRRIVQEHAHDRPGVDDYAP